MKEAVRTAEEKWRTTTEDLRRRTEQDTRILNETVKQLREALEKCRRETKGNTGVIDAKPTELPKIETPKKTEALPRP